MASEGKDHPLSSHIADFHSGWSMFIEIRKQDFGKWSTVWRLGASASRNEHILPEPSPAIELRKRKVSSSNDNFSEV
jgi:hypothetical protein